MKKLILIAALLLSGCQAAIYGTASDFNELEVGMTKHEVISVLGQPVSRQIDPDTGREQLVYKKMKHAISSWPRTYVVTFKDDLVIGFGEQYKEQNVNHF